MEKPSSRDIPNPVKRAVRQRCGFGCVICGSPIYHYDHMKEWAIYQRHVAEEITLLCPTHHQEKTSGLLSSDTVESYNANPYNKKILYSPKWKIHYGKEIKTIIGTVSMTFPEVEDYNNVEFFSVPLMVGGQPVIWFNLEDGNLLLNIVILGKSQPILVISNNELVYSIASWDIEFVGRTLTIREGLRKVIFNITFDVSRNQVIIDKGFFVWRERTISITKEYFEINSVRFYGGGVEGGKYGIIC
ncbi:HNH endonuclease [Paenibacillus sp. NPDC057934]|uniref:HNH endonuclease n=1 Tax=Paenibacillus sp. NPDC057934 TaxID=3346282 RepID=UPI0036DCD9E1